MHCSEQVGENMDLTGRIIFLWPSGQSRESVFYDIHNIELTRCRDDIVKLISKTPIPANCRNASRISCTAIIKERTEVDFLGRSIHFDVTADFGSVRVTEVLRR
jgi:hypothetical protein